MTERVEEIRRAFILGHCSKDLSAEVAIGDLLTALAQAEQGVQRNLDMADEYKLRWEQAEREREEDQERAARLATWLDEARAEVERLKGERDHAREIADALYAKERTDRADLARVQAALDWYAKGNIDGGIMAREALQAALEGRKAFGSMGGDLYT